MNAAKVNIYIADTAVLSDASLFQRISADVSAARREKISRLCLEKDRRLSLGAEYLLLRACRDFSVDYDKVRIVTDEFSKPKFADLPLHFSLSHSGDRAMCIMAEAPVGCDTEKKRPVKPQIAKRFFSADEYRSIAGCETAKAREALFFKLWTLKESFIKCTGRGLCLPLNAFSVSVGQNGIRITQGVDDAAYLLFEKDFGDGYQYAWCMRAAANEPPFSEDAAHWKFIELQRM